MAVFLIQTSGQAVAEIDNPEYAAVAKGGRLCDEIFQYGEYLNASPYWQESGFGRYDAWQTVSEGDQVLIYCTGSVEKYGASLSHLATVADVNRDRAEAARLTFDTIQELAPTIPYQDLMEEYEDGRLSESMRYCGQEGFNFTQVTKQDLKRVHELTTAVDQTEESPPDSLQEIANEYFESEQ